MFAVKSGRGKVAGEKGSVIADLRLQPAVSREPLGLELVAERLAERSNRLQPAEWNGNICLQALLYFLIQGIGIRFNFNRNISVFAVWKKPL